MAAKKQETKKQDSTVKKEIPLKDEFAMREMLFDSQKARYIESVHTLADFMRKQIAEFESYARNGIDEEYLAKSCVHPTTFELNDWAFNALHNMDMNIHVGKFFRMARDIDSERRILREMKEKLKAQEAQ